MDNTNLYADPKPVEDPKLITDSDLVTAPDFVSDEIESPIFFPVSPFKLVLMSIVTLGSYEFYWMYKNWKLIQEHSEPNISPFWRSWFPHFYCYSLFKKIREAAEPHKIPAVFNPAALAVGWIILSVSWKLPDPFGLIWFFSVLLLLPVQKTVNQLNAAVSPDHNPNSRFSGLNILAVIVGTLVIGFGVAATFAALPTKVLLGTELTPRQTQLLQDNGIVAPDEQILMFYSQAFMSILQEGNLITDKRVISYEKEDEDIWIYDARYHEITDIIVEQKGDALKDTSVKIALADDQYFFVVLSAEDQGDDRFLGILQQKWSQSSPWDQY
ncbi:MAG: DUF4234 domain-containing protein [Planctomycetes bacterium]|nr:DUF4234 domain-containing protein [Planctomycetota bacterium]